MLVTSEGPWGKGRWFICDDSHRQYIANASTLIGSAYEGETPTIVEDGFLLERTPKSPIGRRIVRPPLRRIKSSLDMREVATGGLSGTGIEFGAGASPLAVPMGVNVLFADTFTYQELIQNAYKGQELNDIVHPDIILSFDSISSIKFPEELDFIIACHVIEHVANPIRAILDSLNILKSGGKIVLIVPDKRKTFDRKRRLTRISHLIEDFESPNRDRDFEHFMDFYTHAMPPERRETIPRVAKENHNANFPIHYHTFTHHSFKKLLKAIKKLDCSPFDYWIRKARSTEVDIEFYVVITKR